jgi:hypothetical protein
MAKMPAWCVIMDIDGTLANADHRVHLIRDEKRALDSPNWEAFLAAAADDVPNPEIVILSNKLAESYPVFMVTGRSENERAMTEDWLVRHGIDYDKLLMRGKHDRRHDTVIKVEILEEIREWGYEPLFAVEDRAAVTAMWRANGVRCLQVCEGNY